jgi:hypothetical protein
VTLRALGAGAAFVALLTTGFIVDRPADSSVQTVPRWRLIEAWRKGGEVDGAFAFERPRDMTAMPGGRIVVLEASSPKVRIIDSGGAIVRAVGATGSGPGELRGANAIGVSRTGHFVVNDPQNARFSLYAPNGDFIRSVTAIRRVDILFGVGWTAAFDREGRLLSLVGIRPEKPDPRAGMLGVMADSAVAVERWAADYSRSDTLAFCAAPQPSYVTGRSYIVPVRSAMPGSSGQAMATYAVPFTRQRPYATFDQDGYEWGPLTFGSREIVRRQSGQCGRILSRAMIREPRARIPARIWDSATNHVPDEQKRHVPREYLWYRALRVDDQGQLWVERDAAEGRRFDVFASDGRPLGEVPVPTQLLDGHDWPVLIAHGRVFGFVRDSDDIVHLVAWRIVR